MKDNVMVKINKYLIATQFVLLNLIGQNLTQCAAKIQSKQRAVNKIILFDAVKIGSKGIVKLLLDNGADININAVNKGYTALMLASGLGYKDIVELLIKHGANVNAYRKDGVTALYQAVLNGRKEIVELLLQAQANVNVVGCGRYTALMMAAHNCHKEIVELLLHSGADVNAANSNEDTALILASANTRGWIDQWARKEIVRMLLHAGANIDHKNKAGKMAIDLNREKNNHEMVKILQDEPARRESKILECQKIISNKISNLPNKTLVNDVITLISQYTLSTYSGVVEFEKTNPNIIEMLLKANEQLNTGNNFKRKADDDNDESDKVNNKKTRLSESAITTLIAQLKEKKAAINKEIIQLRVNIDNTALIESKEEEIVNINSEIESLEKSLNSQNND